MIQDGINPKLIVGAGTEVIAGEGMILTAGGYDSPHPFHLPPKKLKKPCKWTNHHDRWGTGPAYRTNATTCTPGAWNIGKMLQSADEFPMNLGFWGREIHPTLKLSGSK